MRGVEAFKVSAQLSFITGILIQWIKSGVCLAKQPMILAFAFSLKPSLTTFVL